MPGAGRVWPATPVCYWRPMTETLGRESRQAKTSTPVFKLDFARAYGDPVCSALVRATPEDFQVDERMTQDFDGSGEHLCVLIRKRNQNTRWLAAQIAEQLQLPEFAVGYCGLKDRRAVTTQWFSIHLPEQGAAGRTSPDGQKVSDKRLLQGLHLDQCQILTAQRHGKKLRRGMHSGNRFKLRLRDVAGDRVAVDRRLEDIASGVPNYFGEQRFGIDGQNLVQADTLLRKPRVRGGGRNGIYLSAARSYLFNTILAARVEQDCWAGPLLEEDLPEAPVSEAGASDPASKTQRPDGALWGRGRAPVPPEVARFEKQALLDWGDWLSSLEHCGLRQERRDLVLVPQNFDYHWQGEDLVLNFDLPVGAYATALLRELLIARVAP